MYKLGFAPMYTLLIEKEIMLLAFARPAEMIQWPDVLIADRAWNRLYKLYN